MGEDVGAGSDDCDEDELFTSVGCEDPAETIQRATDEVHQEFQKDPQRYLDELTDAERAATEADPKFAQSNYGKAMERAVAEHPEVKPHFQHVGGANNPDFLLTTRHGVSPYELATNSAGAFLGHVNRWYVEPLTYITYPSVPF
ncbi:hypothetical protein [Streptomyces sp. NPDC006997]|uniref:hypothetical protein n=1 Tax=Streptomyces sp. NPDC006997 TaxID=3155356 RepID=UPI0033E35023